MTESLNLAALGSNLGLFFLLSGQSNPSSTTMYLEKVFDFGLEHDLAL